MYDQGQSDKRPDTYALKLDPGTNRVYLYDGLRFVISFDSRVFPVSENIVDWPTVGYTENMGPWRNGEYTTVAGWHHFLLDPYSGPCIALFQ